MQDSKKSGSNSFAESPFNPAELAGIQPGCVVSREILKNQPRLAVRPEIGLFIAVSDSMQPQPAPTARIHSRLGRLPQECGTPRDPMLKART
jgi:hypothetical protein